MLKKMLLLVAIVMIFSVSASHGYQSANLNFQETPLTSQSCNYLSPQDIMTAYGFSALYAGGINGTGESIAIVVAHGDQNLQQDVNAFDSYYGIAPLTNGSNLAIETPFGSPSSYPVNWTSETALDVEVAHSLAPGAKIYLIVSPNDSWLFQTVNYTINNVPANTISISWGSSELNYNQQNVNYINEMFSYAQSKGINVFVASGDSGAYNSYKTPNVNFPASSPNVVSVGGTSLSVYSNGGYKSETGWNQSGGGQSQFFSKPAFQPGTGSYRMVPDVAFNAGTPICIYAGSKWGGFYGTSVAAPSWSAVDSLINQNVRGDEGYINKNLYTLSNRDGTLIFNNITSGCNGLYCADGKYNEVTGLGSPKVYQLTEALSNTSYQIYFNDTGNGLFSVNGKNYTKPLTLKFAFGQKVNIVAYSNAGNTDTRTKFVAFSGLVDTDNFNASFFVNQSGAINMDFITYLRISEHYYNGVDNKSEYVQSGNYFNISASKFWNYSDHNYVLQGFYVDNGTLIQKNGYELKVFSPLNISFSWLENYKTDFVFLGGSAGLKANVSYYSNVPLSKAVKNVVSLVENNGYVYSVNNSKFSLYGLPQIINGNRYVFVNFSRQFTGAIHVNFIKEYNYSIEFSSKQNKSITPSDFYIKFGDISQRYNSSYIWAPKNTEFTLGNVSYDGVNVTVNASFTTAYNKKFLAILPISDVNLKIVTILGIPVVGATVTLDMNNMSFTNSTNLLGGVTFANLPQKPYNATVNAYDSSYSFNNLDMLSYTLTITAGLYELYIISGVVAVVLVLLLLFERVRHRKHK